MLNPAALSPTPQKINGRQDNFQLWDVEGNRPAVMLEGSTDKNLAVTVGIRQPTKPISPIYAGMGDRVRSGGGVSGVIRRAPVLLQKNSTCFANSRSMLLSWYCLSRKKERSGKWARVFSTVQKTLHFHLSSVFLSDSAGSNFFLSSLQAEFAQRMVRLERQRNHWLQQRNPCEGHELRRKPSKSNDTMRASMD
jgi:hypothetical protein